MTQAVDDQVVLVVAAAAVLGLLSGWAAARRCAMVQVRMRPAVAVTLALSGAVATAFLAFVRLDDLVSMIVVVHLAVVGLPLAAVDATTGMLPRRQVYATYLTTLIIMTVAATIQGPRVLIGIAASAAALGVFFTVLAWLGGVGAGDARLAPVLGAHLGHAGLATAFIGTSTAFVIGAVMAIAFTWYDRTAKFRPNARSRRIPFGPALIGGAVIALVL